MALASGTVELDGLGNRSVFLLHGVQLESRFLDEDVLLLRHGDLSCLLTTASGFVIFREPDGVTWTSTPPSIHRLRELLDFDETCRSCCSFDEFCDHVRQVSHEKERTRYASSSMQQPSEGLSHASVTVAVDDMMMMMEFRSWPPV